MSRSIGEARGFLGAFVTAYNHEHHDTGIGLHTPADVHHGHTTEHDPRILALPTDAWINQPAETSAA